MRARTSLLPAALVSVATVMAACTVLLPFELEGLACDEIGQCLDEYTCVDGICVRLDGGVPCGGCESGQRCDEVSSTCIPDSCTTRGCAVNSTCVQNDAGRTACLPLTPPAEGHACSDDGQCAGGVCFKGAVLTASGLIRTGTCLEPCLPGAGSCTAQGATCRPFDLAEDAGQTNLCIPDNLVRPCTDDSTCAPLGLVCTVFDHPATGPISICDAPLKGGAAEGGACVNGTTNDAGSLCGNGLCLPRNAGSAQATCSVLCDGDSDCAGGESCRLVEFDLQQGFPVRQLPMCAPAATACTDCSSGNAVCGADAPHCTFLPASGGPRCLSACTPGGGTSPNGGTLECPPGATCQEVTPGVSRCIPAAGCP